jgi:hypothetical protein
MSSHVIEGNRVEILKLFYQYFQFTVQVAVKWYNSNVYIHNAFGFSHTNSVCSKVCLGLHKVCHVRYYTTHPIPYVTVHDVKKKNVEVTA